MPPNQFYQTVVAHLKSLNIHFSDRWVNDTITNVTSNYPGIAVNDVGKKVYEKWLSTNLRDIKVGSFPPNVKSQEKITLTGNYAVQVESMINSARSCYLELQTIENPGKLENVGEKSDEHANSKRCLTFLLCDGVQEIQAMEYQFIPTLKLNDPGLLPGFKMLVRGPVVCRKGMILLKQENVKVYGGMVDTLCETNNIIKLLKKKLGLSLENDESNNQSILRNNNMIDHSTVQSVQPRENIQPQWTDNNISDSAMEMDELLSQNDDILLNVSFEPGFEDEYNQGSRHEPEFEREFEEHSFQVTKKPKVNSFDEDLVKQNKKNQFLNNISIIGRENHPSLTESWISNTSKKVESNNTESIDYGNPSTSKDKNEIPSLEQYSFDDDGDIIFEEEVLFQSQNFPVKEDDRIPKQTPGKCIQMKMPSYFNKQNDSPILRDTTSSSHVEKKCPKTVMSYPYVYLKQITEISLMKQTKFKVKAIILTLKSKISIKNDEYSLKACISDGSSTIQVNFSSETLESILEYSPCEVTSMMGEKARNSAIGDRLKGIFFSAQQKLLSMNCLMEIEFYNNGTMPLVVGLEEIKLEHVNALKGRSC